VKSGDDHALLTLELNLEADSVAGVVRGASGSGEPFVGWMALTRAIELTLEAARLGRPSVVDVLGSSAAVPDVPVGET
jgi:hypothetical protein